jgi:hypothetical protein
MNIHAEPSPINHTLPGQPQNHDLEGGNAVNSETTFQRLERWAFAVVILLAIGAFFVFGLEALARAAFVRGATLISIGLIACIAVVVGALAFSTDRTAS